ncbi:MAG: S9 family peptidase [Planctomycetes bacterium]|nr:S9 family peptidase [Planctomycetota bacterium]
MQRLRSRTALCFLSLLVAASTLARAQEQARRLSPELLWQLARVNDPQVSPDGERLLYELREYSLAANRGTSQVMLLELGSGSARALTASGSNRNARWSPDGKSVAFLSTRSGAPQVFVIAVDGGEARQLTQVEGGVDNLLWSPDGARLAFTARVKLDPDVHDLHPDLPLADAKVYDDLMVRHWDSWNDGTYNHLFVVDRKGGEPRDLMAGLRAHTPLPPFGGLEQITWTPDSQALVYAARRVPDDARLLAAKTTNSGLWLAPLDGGEPVDLVPDFAGYDTNPAFSPDGKHFAWLSMARDGYESDVNRLMVADFDPKARRLGGARRADQWDGTVTEFSWAADGRSLLFAADWRGTTPLFRVGRGGGEPQRVTSGRWQFTSPVCGPGGDFAYALRQQTERPAELVRIALGGEPGEGQALTDHNGEVFATLALPKVEERWFQASDGERIHAWVVLPPDFDPKRRWPMLLFCQGGPQSQVGQGFSTRWNFHLMASQGYVVLAVNRRGLPGFGSRWNEQISRDWGGQCMQDLLSATDAMQQEPYIDRARTAAVGASFGGYTVYWLMGHDPQKRFAAMIAHCGVFNLESMYLSTEELFFVDWDLGGPFWRDDAIRADYERFSPHRFVGEWRTPLLVIHGQQDFRVPLEQGLQAFTAARLQGCPSRFVYFPGESHWVLGPQNGVLWQRLFFDWLDRWCKTR